MVYGIIQCDWRSKIFVVRSVGWWKMPSEIVSFAVSTGLGVSMIAGILSGVCYIWAHGVSKRSNRPKSRAWYCDVCGAFLRTIERILEEDQGVICIKCQGKVCKLRCSSLNPQQTGWTCKTCLRPPEYWFQGILNAIQPSKRVDLPNKMNLDSLNEIDEDLEAIRKKEKEQVRDFIERLVNVMLGENVDDACITKLYDDKSYLPITGQSPCTAHATLKRIIERLLDESKSLPCLQKAQEQPTILLNENNRTYESLLATAIINKVISSCQKSLPTSSAASVSSRLSNASNPGDNKEYFFGEETLDSKWKTTDLESSSASSLEEWIHSDSSLGSKKYVDRVTLTIKQDIEEISATDSENEEDAEYFRTKSSLLTEDEPNWFLQKRHFQGTPSPVPVPMLVPNPLTEAKVLIGDVEADETSDLSDVASDYGETEVVLGRQNLLIESRTVIGGKNPLNNGGSESESSADSGVKEVDNRDKSGYDELDFVAKTDITVDDDNVEDASLLSTYSNTEQEAEYTERYASLPRTIMKTPTPPLRPSLQKGINQNCTKLDNKVDKENEEKTDHTEAQYSEEFSGIYSKREKEKWKHAVEMKNNPYSRENIEKRIKRSSSAVSSLFGPDYYARQASSPAGAKLKSSEANDTPWTHPSTKEEKDNGKREVYSTVPSIIFSDEDVFEPEQKKGDPIRSEVKQRLNRSSTPTDTNGSEVTSDSDLSYINFYDVENSQVYRKTREKSDENGNISSEKDKHREEGSALNEPKARPRYAKLNSVALRTFNKPQDTFILKRHKSETDLLSDSFDTPPTVISRKKDNTLISKIYQDPHVRSFALSKRDRVPGEDTVSSPTFGPGNVSQIRYDSNNTSYNSDDGIPSSQKEKTLFSSEEDLIQRGSALNKYTTRPKVNISSGVRNYSVRSSRLSVSSDDALSDHSSLNNYDFIDKRSTRNQIYSSSDDLLSMEPQEKPLKKKDNTLISKIYQNQNVRNFAMQSRDYIPEENIKSKTHFSSEEDILSDASLRAKNTPTIKIIQRSNIQNSLSDDSVTINKNPVTKLPQDSSPHNPTIIPNPLGREIEFEINLNSPDPEINELAKKKIVHNILGQFSKSHQTVVSKKTANDEHNQLAGAKNTKTEEEVQPPVIEKIVSEEQVNLAANKNNDNEIQQDARNAEDEISISVKDLMKKFENRDSQKKVISSLTARSLSKQMRETLRN